MCSTTEVAGNIKWHAKAPKKVVDEALQAYTEGSSQWLPRQAKNVTYVSRLECVQVYNTYCFLWFAYQIFRLPCTSRYKLNSFPVTLQAEVVAKSNPNHRLGLITFNDEGC